MAARPLKIAISIERFGRGSGTAGYAESLAAGLADAGHQVTVFTAAGSSADSRVQIILLKPIVRRGVAGQIAWVFTQRQIPRTGFDVHLGLGRGGNADVARAGGGSHVAWLAARALVAGGQRWHGPADRLELALDKTTLQKASVVIANSEMAAAQLRRDYGLKRVCLVRTGVDLQRFRPDAEARHALRHQLRVPEGGRIALFLGHGFRRKGLAVAGAAFAAVAGPSDRFVVVGRDAHAARHLGPLAGLGERLYVAGAVSDPQRWLAAADVTLLPTVYDAAANSTLEALACGVPPITSKCDGNAELLPPELVVADPADVRGFATALDRVWRTASPPAASLRAVAETWPASRNVAGVAAVLQEFCDARR